MPAHGLIGLIRRPDAAVLGGVGVESNRPAANLSDFTVGSNKLGRLVEKVGSRAKTAK